MQHPPGSFFFLVIFHSLTSSLLSHHGDPCCSPLCRALPLSCCPHLLHVALVVPPCCAALRHVALTSVALPSSCCTCSCSLLAALKLGFSLLPLRSRKCSLPTPLGVIFIFITDMHASIRHVTVFGIGNLFTRISSTEGVCALWCSVGDCAGQFSTCRPLWNV